MPAYEWVSVAEASRRLGRSVSTIRRQIEAGELIGEREPLAKGSPRDRYRVRLEAPETPREPSGPEPPPTSPHTPETLQDAPAAISGLLELIAADRETIQQQAAEIRALAERVGRSEAERDRLQDELERERRPIWRKLWDGLIG